MRIASWVRVWNIRLRASLRQKYNVTQGCTEQVMNCQNGYMKKQTIDLLILLTLRLTLVLGKKTKTEKLKNKIQIITSECLNILNRETEFNGNSRKKKKQSCNFPSLNFAVERVAILMIHHVS